MNQKGFVNILIAGIVIIAIIGAASYYYITNRSIGFIPISSQNQQQYTNKVSSKQEGIIISFGIEPSTKSQGWIMYHDGAKAILKGENLNSAEVQYFPTGSGITQSSLVGKMNKVGNHTNLSHNSLELWTCTH